MEFMIILFGILGIKMKIMKYQINNQFAAFIRKL